MRNQNQGKPMNVTSFLSIELARRNAVVAVAIQNCDPEQAENLAKTLRALDPLRKTLWRIEGLVSTATEVITVAAPSAKAIYKLLSGPRTYETHNRQGRRIRVTVPE